MAVNKLKPMLVLENGTLLSMALNSKLLTEFPFLGTIVPSAGVSSCGSCAAAEKDKRTTAYEVVKQRIATMSSEMQRKLKTYLGVSQLRVHYKSTGGRTMTVTV